MIGLVILAAVLLCALVVILLLDAIGKKTTVREIDKEAFVFPAVTEVPPPEYTAWTRYDVNLDDELQQYIGDLCKRYGVDAAVVMALIETESDCDPNTVSDNGNSWGLMQIYATQHTARCVRLGAWNLLDPQQNVRVGIDYLAELLGIGHGIEWALSWYNGHGGEPCEYADRVLTEAERLMESAQTVVS